MKGFPKNPLISLMKPTLVSAEFVYEKLLL